MMPTFVTPQIVTDALADPVRAAIWAGAALAILALLLLLARALPFVRSTSLILWFAFWAACVGLLGWQLYTHQPLSLIAILFVGGLTWQVVEAWRLRNTW